MGLFNLFKKKEPKEDLSLLPICPYCSNYIRDYETIKTFHKKKYHISCFRKSKKQALKNKDFTSLSYLK